MTRRSQKGLREKGGTCRRRDRFREKRWGRGQERDIVRRKDGFTLFQGPPTRSRAGKVLLEKTSKRRTQKLIRIERKKRVRTPWGRYGTRSL